VTVMLKVRVAMAIIGIVIWGYGVAAEHPDVRLVGIAVLALSLALRFLPKRSQPNSDQAP
jgi:hypothetical protein